MDKYARVLFRPIVLLLVLAVSLITFTGIVFAADGPADPMTNPQGALQQLWDAIVSRRWGLAAVIATMLLVAFVRFVSPKLHGRFGDWVQQSRVSAALALLGGLSTSVAAQLLKGDKFSLNVLAFGFGVGVAAIGGYNAFWDLLFPNDKLPKRGPSLPPPIRPGVLLPFIFLCSVVTTGCAPGTDGLRQACANANITLTQTTVTGTAIYKLGHQTLRANLTKENADATQAKAKSYDTAMDKFLVAMLMITATKSTVCDAADAIDAGAKKNVRMLIAQAGQIIIDAATALAELQKLIDTSQKTSDANRLIALASYRTPLVFIRLRAAVL